MCDEVKACWRRGRGTRELAETEVCSCKWVGESSTGMNIRSTISDVVVHRTRSLAQMSTPTFYITETKKLTRLKIFLDASRYQEAF